MFSGQALRQAVKPRRPGFVAELTIARRAMACDFSLTLPNWVQSAADAGYAALDEVDRLEELLSVYIEDSELSRVNQLAAAGPVPVRAETYDLLKRALRLSCQTGGAFDPAAGALVKAWGFYRGPKRVPSDTEREAALAVSGCGFVRLSDNDRTVTFARPGVEFNLGGIGKGYAIDRALTKIHQQYGVRCALMQGGRSSLRVIGAPLFDPRGWMVEIGDPLREGKTVARVWLRDQALGTSGADNQFFVADGKRYGHILDPRTGWPARRVLSSSVIARTATEADALSTAFFVLGLEGTKAFCRTRPEITAILVVPGKSAPEVVVIGEADVEVFQ